MTATTRHRTLGVGRGRTDRVQATVLLLILAVALVLLIGGAISIATLASDGDPTASEWILILVGAALMIPGVAWVLSSQVGLALRMFRQRQAWIDVGDDKLVMHDSLMLREPLVLARRDVASIERVDPLTAWQRSGLSLEGRREVAGDLLVDTRLRTYNARIHLARQRRFVEAHRQLGRHPRGAYDLISTNKSGLRLLVELDEPDRAIPDLDRWLGEAKRKQQPKRPRLKPRRGIPGFVYGIAFFVGIILVTVGATLAG